MLFRTLQGICGAALLPLSQAILLDINPKERHGRAMAIWGMGVVLGPILGPLLGGWLTEDYSWRWVFFVNMPFGILAAIGIIASLPETKPKKSTFDMFGFAALSIGIGALQLMLDRGELKDWFSLHRDPHRSAHRGHRPVPVHRAHRDGGALVHQPRRCSRIATSSSATSSSSWSASCCSPRSR